MTKYIVSSLLVLLISGCQPEGKAQNQTSQEAELGEADVIVSDSELAEMKAAAGGTISVPHMMYGRPRQLISDNNFEEVADHGISLAITELYQAFKMFLLREKNPVLGSTLNCPDEGEFVSYKALNTWSSTTNSVSFYEGGLNCVDYKKKWKWVGILPMRFIVGMTMHHGVEVATIGWNGDELTDDVDAVNYGLKVPEFAVYKKGIVEVEPPKAGGSQLKEIRDDLSSADPSILMKHDPSDPVIIEGIRNTDFSQLLDNGISHADDYPDLRYAKQESDVLTDLDSNEITGYLKIWVANEVQAEFQVNIEEHELLDPSDQEYKFVETRVVNIQMTIPGFSFEGKSFNGTAVQMAESPFDAVDGERISVEAEGLVGKAIYNPFDEYWTVYPFNEGRFTVFADGGSYVTGSFYSGGVDYVLYELVDSEAGRYTNKYGNEEFNFLDRLRIGN